MKWLALASILLAGCLNGPEATMAPAQVHLDLCDEDHLSMYVAPMDWTGINGTLLEENGLNLLTIYRFQCGDQMRELWGLELEPETAARERWLLKECGFQASICITDSDFKIDGEILLEQYTMVLAEEHTITAKVVKGGDKFPGYTSAWKTNGASIITIHGIGVEIGAGTFTMTPVPWEHYGLIGSPENLVHMVQDVPLQWSIS